jgi:hypothetical protein
LRQRESHLELASAANLVKFIGIERTTAIGEHRVCLAVQIDVITGLSPSERKFTQWEYRVSGVVILDISVGH